MGSLTIRELFVSPLVNILRLCIAVNIRASSSWFALDFAPDRLSIAIFLAIFLRESPARQASAVLLTFHIETVPSVSG